MQVMGYYFVFRSRQLEIKKQMRSYLLANPENSNLITFEYSIPDNTNDKLQWENENEFSYQGNMYDVLDRRSGHDKIVIRCIEDRNETSLLKTFEELLRRQSSSSKSPFASLLQFDISLYVITDITILTPPDDSISLFFCNYNLLLPEHSPEILTPPPQDC